MKIGWNLGNTLDSNSGDTLNMWLEWEKNPPSKYETAWGQPITTKKLIKMFRDAGFNAIRVPVTWYPHMDINCETVNIGNDYYRYWYRSKWNGPKDVDKEWMKRVHEIVDYVNSLGMYCILNVHHDTGASNAAWLRATMNTYNKEKERFESLWTQIATEFKDYDDHLLFESFNEMLDDYSSWCFASFSAPGNYNAQSANDSYKAINSYNQSFVNAVRATGGKNAYRNLIVNTYGACCGNGTWNTHLKDPLKNLEIPDDDVDNRIIAEVHSYISVTNLSNSKNEVNDMMKALKKYFSDYDIPVVIGEWGSLDENAYTTSNKNLNDYARYFVEQAKAYGFATFYWMGLSDGADRTKPKWTQEDLKNSIVKGYYGDKGFIAKPCDANDDGVIDVADITAIASHILGKHNSSWNNMNADANNDGIIDVADITFIAGYILHHH